MPDFTIRSEAVDVEQIMKQIRSRIREKRGVDYTEDQIRELATVRLEKFLDPKNLRSDLLEQFRRSRPAIPDEPPPVEPPYDFSDETLFASHRGPLRIIRKLLRPILKLFFNPNTLNQILYSQAQFNVDVLKREQRRRIEFDRSRSEWNALYYEVLHNLVLETTRNGIELKNLRMRVESLASRLDFNERRVRALEGVVQYRPEATRRDRGRQGRPELDVADEPALDAPLVPTGEGAPPVGAGPSPSPAAGEGRRRRRRRRGRRPASGLPGTPGAAGDTLAAEPMEDDEQDGNGDELDAAADGESARDVRTVEPNGADRPVSGDSDPDHEPQ